MDDLLSEKEQLEQMRAWWSEYGRYVIAGVVIAVGLLLGFNQYKSNSLETQIAASKLYETLAVHITDGDLDDAEAAADELANDYGNTSYAAQARLAMARLYMDKNRDQDAVDVLNELLAVRGNEELKHIGRLRLARILLYQDKAEDVVDLLDKQTASAFMGMNNELLGDAYAALGRIEAAKEAYNKALADPSPAPTVNRGLVQMKLADLPDAVAAGPADTAVAPAADPVPQEATTDALPEAATPNIDTETEAVVAE